MPGEAKCLTFAFTRKYKFLTSAPRPGDLILRPLHACPRLPFLPGQCLCLLLLALSVALFQYSAYFLGGTRSDL